MWREVICLLYKHTNDVFDDFPKISDHFTLKLVRRPRVHFPEISENNQRFPLLFEEDLKIFRSCTNKFNMISYTTSSK